MRRRFGNYPQLFPIVFFYKKGAATTVQQVQTTVVSTME